MYYKTWFEKPKPLKPTDWSKYSDKELHDAAIGAGDTHCHRALREISTEVLIRLGKLNREA